MAREIAPPERLHIGSFVFAFELVAPGDERLDSANGITILDEDEGLAVYVSCALEDRKLVEIVWHEIVHAVDWVYDISKSTSFKRNRDTREEHIAQKHGEAWPTFLLDNPKFARWYMSIIQRIRRERR